MQEQEGNSVRCADLGNIALPNKGKALLCPSRDKDVAVYFRCARHGELSRTKAMCREVVSGNA